MTVVASAMMAMAAYGAVKVDVGVVERNSDSIRAPKPGADRTAWVAATREYRRVARRGIDRSLYDRPEMAWSTRNFACYFLFLYDSRIYDRKRGAYRVEVFLKEMDTRFGGIDSVVLWHAYPRIGIDPRNQFDFYRDMPGGLTGVRGMVDRFHAHGVKVFIDYNPWDTATRREDVSDASALAGLVKTLDADGIFLDTMSAAPAGLRSAVDAARPGVVFEPEGRPPDDQLAVSAASWAQWPESYSEPGLLRLKWIEPRHMQHQIRRWDRGHFGEIETAFFNGSGMLIWENVFGTWNPWSNEDSLSWRRAVRILRAFAPELAGETLDPFVPTLASGVYANRWSSPSVDLYLLVNRSGNGAPETILRPERFSPGRRAFDLWNRRELRPGADGVISAPLDRLGAIAVTHDEEGLRRVRPLLRPLPVSPAPGTAKRADMYAPEPVRRTPAGDPDRLPAGMVYVPGGRVHMRLSHERRECGCYPDPGAAPSRTAYFIWGDPFHETLIHDYTAEVKSFFVDAALVTNGQFEMFLRATGYHPRDATNFLKHWNGPTCPTGLRDHPVVWVDLDDARAYARWAGKRLPTEPEWQRAAQGDDGRKLPWGKDLDPARYNSGGNGTTPVRAYPEDRSPFGCFDMAGNVWQWTESERDDGHTRSAIIRGGSWFDAKGSIWYVHGGARPLDEHTRMLLHSPGIDRCATVGFRCVKDVAP